MPYIRVRGYAFGPLQGVASDHVMDGFVDVNIGPSTCYPRHSLLVRAANADRAAAALLSNPDS